MRAPSSSITRATQRHRCASNGAGHRLCRAHLHAARQLELERQQDVSARMELGPCSRRSTRISSSTPSAPSCRSFARSPRRPARCSSTFPTTIARRSRTPMRSPRCKTSWARACATSTSCRRATAKAGSSCASTSTRPRWTAACRRSFAAVTGKLHQACDAQTESALDRPFLGGDGRRRADRGGGRRHWHVAGRRSLTCSTSSA